MKRTLTVVFVSLVILALAACTGNTSLVTATSVVPQTTSTQAVGSDQASSPADSSTPSTTPSANFDSDDLNTQAGTTGITILQLKNQEISLEGNGATVQGSTVMITSPGTYQISGKLDDGQVIVDSSGEGMVHLILDGAKIHSTTSAPIYIKSADKTVITLADGSENTLLDGDTRSKDEENLNGALFSNDDLTINGLGSLSVTGSYNHGIVSKANLKIASGSLSVEAVNDGIKGKDSIAILDGNINITAGGDGMQAYNNSDLDKGTIVIKDGSITVTAGQDGIQAETTLAISGGDFLISSGGGSSNGPSHWEGMNRQADFGESTTDNGESAKGLKAGLLVSISAGSFSIDAADDTIHSNDAIAINGGQFQLSSGDDGLHADSSLVISGGDIKLDGSYEGLESKQITISGGYLNLVAVDDGINGSSGNGGGGRGDFESGDSNLTISGGVIYVDAGGDGIDINGPIQMSSGLVLVNGPTSNGDGALDYLDEFNISNGILVAVGSAGMAELPSSSSRQPSLMYVYDSVIPAGTPLHLETQDGEEILTFVPTKDYQTVVYSSPTLKLGETYQLFSGGSSSGTYQDGLYTGGVYSGGTPVASITLTDMATSAGAQGKFMMGGPGREGDGGKPPRR